MNNAMGGVEGHAVRTRAGVPCDPECDYCNPMQLAGIKPGPIAPIFQPSGDYDAL